MNRRSFLNAFILSLLIVTYTAAQTPPPVAAPTEDEKKAQLELEKKALTLLDEILDGASLLKLPENRSYIFATAADLLWKYDEKRSRLYFHSAMNDLALSIRTARPDILRGESTWLLGRQRTEILTRAARRDPQFALELLQSTRQSFAENASMWALMMDQDLMLEQTIVTEVAAKDPKRALQMAQESLAKGVSYQTLGLLVKLQSKDSEAATTFAGDIVKSLRTVDFNKTREASTVAQGLLRMLLKPDRPSSGTQSKASAKQSKPLVVDEQTTRDLIDIVINAALNATIERYDTVSLQSLLPELEKRVPERVAQLRKKLSENTERLDPAMSVMMQYQTLMMDGKPEALVEAATKAPPEMRVTLYRYASMKYSQNGDLENARKVIVEHLGSDSQLLARVDQLLVARALEANKLDEARKLIDRITPTEARLAQIAYMAMGLFAKGERKLAIALLNETQDLVNRAPENLEEMNAMLLVAKAFARIEPTRVFSIIEPVIDQTNSLLAAASVLAKFDVDYNFFKDGELLMQTGTSNSGRVASKIFGIEMGLLARADFARTRSLVDRFQRDEARMMARLLLAQGVLTDRSESEKSTSPIVETYSY